MNAAAPSSLFSPAEEQDSDAAPAASALTRWAEPGVILTLIVVAALTAYFVPGLSSRALLSPLAVALILVANLIPAMALLVLAGRRIALRRARSRGGGARLHTRLVALFSITAAIPTLLVVIFSSFLFQSGMDFWFSDRSRGMFENAVRVAQDYFDTERQDVRANTRAMAVDLTNELSRYPIDSQPFSDFYVQQVVVRELGESAIIEVGPDGIARTAALIDPDNRAADSRLPAETIERLMAGEPAVTNVTQDRVEATVRLLPDRPIFLYAARRLDMFGLESVRRARSVFADYNALFGRSRDLQFRFVGALYLGSLILMVFVIVAAFVVADRIISPIDQLVRASQKVSAGDLETRVRIPDGPKDEIAVLASAFNTMTERLGEQTRDLLAANEQIETRRAFIETVLGAVASGVVSVDAAGRIQLVNSAAETMLGRQDDELIGQPIEAVAPELAEWLAHDEDSASRDPILSVQRAGDTLTWQVKVTGDHNGQVVTFEDITRQLFDQRRAAWSDVARRVAHEIKNPLTPIQLAAERLQRRFGAQDGKDGETFAKLTSTIVRQVGDLRRMVDEFSSFARMPKPTFREDNLGDVVKQSLFLHEVAHPEVRFALHMPDDAPPVMLCDRRLLAQAFTNLVKNAVEATERAGGVDRHVTADIAREGAAYIVTIADNGVGLPADRGSITLPYFTTRDGGTGLGLAIVKRIVEEHGGELHFHDRDGGGTQVKVILPIDGGQGGAVDGWLERKEI
jgi:two-component system nitrogen regulation sensor histidine kinase NtrY